MIHTRLELMYDGGCVTGVFPHAGILYLCAHEGSLFLQQEACGTVLSAFIKTNRKIVMAGFAGCGSDLHLQTLASGMTVQAGLRSYRVALSKRIVRPRRRAIVAVGIVSCIVIMGMIVPRMFAERIDESYASVVTSERSKTDNRQHAETARLEQLLKHDESPRDVPTLKLVIDEDRQVSVSREAYGLCEEGIGLLEAGKHAEAIGVLTKARRVAAQLPVEPPYMRKIDEAMERAERAIENERRCLYAAARARIDAAIDAEPREAFKIVAALRAELARMSADKSDIQVADMRVELAKVHRMHVSTVLARAHTLERLEGCRAAYRVYEDAMESFGDADVLLAREIRAALKRCDSRGRL